MPSASRVFGRRVPLIALAVVTPLTVGAALATGRTSLLWGALIGAAVGLGVASIVAARRPGRPISPGASPASRRRMAVWVVVVVAVACISLGFLWIFGTKFAIGKLFISVPYSATVHVTGGSATFDEQITITDAVRTSVSRSIGLLGESPNVAATDITVPGWTLDHLDNGNPVWFRHTVVPVHSSSWLAQRLDLVPGLADTALVVTSKDVSAALRPDTGSTITLIGAHAEFAKTYPASVVTDDLTGGERAVVTIDPTDPRVQADLLKSPFRNRIGTYFYRFSFWTPLSALLALLYGALCGVVQAHLGVGMVAVARRIMRRPAKALALHTVTWGSGDRVAVLLHGMTGSAASWHAVGPALADRGFRVIAVDLPGHGESPRDPQATVETNVSALLASVPGSPALAIGHSMGGVILAAAVSRLLPGRAVYVDTTFTGTRRPGESDAATVAREYAEQKAARTLAALRERRPWWSPVDLEAEAEAATRWDVATATALSMSAAGRDFTPPLSGGLVATPSTMVYPDPSDYVTPDFAADLAAHGFTLRRVPGAGHTIWYGHLAEFLAAIDNTATDDTATDDTAIDDAATDNDATDNGRALPGQAPGQPG